MNEKRKANQASGSKDAQGDEEQSSEPKKTKKAKKKKQPKLIDYDWYSVTGKEDFWIIVSPSDRLAHATDENFC